MIDRETPLVIPVEDARYFQLEAAGRTFQLKQPFPLDVADVVMEIQQRKANETDGVSNLSANWAGCGAMLGLAWADPGKALESDRDSFADLHAYGRAVLAELYEDGVDAPHYNELFPPLMKSLTSSLVGDAAVAQRVDFTGPTEAKPNLPN